MKKMYAATMIALALLIGALPAASQTKLNGAGATFPYVIYSTWFDHYQRQTGVQFNYQSIGSGGGIRQVIQGTVDFGATDAPMTDEQLKEAQEKQGLEIIHIPTVMGAVAVIYNLPEAGKDLKLTPDVLASIFLGQITTWNDPKIVEVNPGKNFPAKGIIVTHRSDGSGTTSIFTDYLTQVSKPWEERVGKGTAVKWPVGLGGKGNEGVAGLVKQTEGSVGYVELAYAVQNNLPYASLKNREGVFVAPTLEGVTAAAAGAASSMPEDMRVSLVNAPGKGSYPISSFTWLLVAKNPKDREKGGAIQTFLRWAMKDGQGYAKDLHYAPLPKEVITRVEKKINGIQVP